MGNEYQIYQSFPTAWLGAWESVNGNPDMYIFQGYDGNYYLLAYSYDKECQRGSFSCYDMDSDEGGWYIRMGINIVDWSPKNRPMVCISQLGAAI